jgi:diadenosine tetraphosphatase ApaH/serine/threonine PP2A family protein phosphatase
LRRRVWLVARNAGLLMRIALFSDIHANREAFDACLAHASRQRIDRMAFLGDLVGYGADPQYVIDRVRREMERGAVAVLGNHDEAAVDADTNNMNDYARLALEWTHRALSADARAFLGGLPMEVAEDDRLFVHADASNPRGWPYVSDVASAERSLCATRQRLTFCGHIHRPQIYHVAPNRPPQFFAPKSGTATPLINTRKWLCVLGAVGQPRDDNPAAAYCVLDAELNEITYHRVAYDIDRAAAKIRSAGLPQILAARLFIGR